jgi:hypothetical protein
MEIWECSCGTVWEVPEGTIPVECPACGGTEIEKQGSKPGGNKPINWPGSIGG